MTENLKSLASPFKEMLENYKLAKRQFPKNFNSKHWDVFPADYEKTILSESAWKNFLRNSISIGFNDELASLGNRRWNDNMDDSKTDVWALRKQHDYRVLIENIDDLDGLVTTFNIVATVCSVEFVLDNLGSNTGSPATGNLSVNLVDQLSDTVGSNTSEETKTHVFSCNNFDLVMIYYFWQISRIMDKLISTERPLIVEIGPGYGLMMSKMKKKYPQSRCVLLDLPELSAVQSYYLSCEFPEAKIFYYRDLLEYGPSLFEMDFDFLILPGWMISTLPKNSVDVTINTRSMMEMNNNTIKYYFDHIHLTMKEHGILACFNRYEKNTAGEVSRIKHYPYDDYWSILLSQTSIMQEHIHELILGRLIEKNKFPVAEVLKSLQPFGS